ncbi:NYN domain-containing protein [Rubrivirga sp. S365]|uniref:NYN domain-containing protein n=1 Tax=Rubrivirga litoralis TaxID=3075598 RepID=A0ABU3BMZ9_9BACT|nr:MULTISPECIES: NYN domain-containing protein [unclassified Rubrivirga]MDT0630652.1 NYN domain-containing protein [Rubrivirga sp. F394]MDT7857635.1 NYN domain-containing protein [Rubrivirga sp. S365]
MPETSRDPADRPAPAASAPPEGTAPPESEEATRQAAILIDYQNLHHYLKGRLDDRRTGSTADLASALLKALRERLAGEGLRLARGRAYADFGGLDDHSRHVQRSLYLHGVEPVYVPATMHRNTTDLQLAVDAVEMRDRHPEVETVVLLSGDRDYAPVVSALVAAGRRVVVIGFQEHLSPYLLEHTEGGAFLDAADLLPSDALAPEVEVGAPIQTTEFVAVQDPAYEIDYDAIETIEKFFGQYEEIYLTPLLRRLSDEIGEVDGHDPKSLVADLEECGAARLERRRGMPYDYTVLLLNGDHPAVVEVREEVHGAPVVAADDGLPFDDEPEL